MRLCITVSFAFLALITITSEATSPLPAQILCKPEENYRAGIEKLDPPGPVAYLLEYGGKVTITQVGNEIRYLYGKGQAFYQLKVKTAYSDNFVNIQQDVFLYSDPGWADSSSVLILRDYSGTGFFHIDWAKQRYYGYMHELGAINSFAGSCTILKT